MISSQYSVEKPRDDVYFFLWLQTIICFLTAIPLIANLTHDLLHTQTIWTLPKIYELKIYAATMLLAGAIPLLLKNKLLNTKLIFYRSYSLLFLPLALSIYALSSANISIIFILSLLGFILFYFEKKYSLPTTKINNYYDILFLPVITLTLFFIIIKSSTPSFSFQLLPTTGLFLFFYLIIQSKNFNCRYLILFLPIFLYIVTFASSGGTDYHHQVHVLGPVIEVLNGHQHPYSVTAQYGSGLTAFVAGYFKLRGGFVDLLKMQQLLKFLTLLQYLLLFAIANYLYQSKKLAFLTLVSIIFFTFYSQVDLYYACPSIGFLRFGWIYLILFCYLLEGRFFSPMTTCFTVAILTTFACLWSFESAVYTLPAVILSEAIHKNLRKFLLYFLISFGFIAYVYFAPLIHQGNWPSLSHYYESALIYANGYGQIPVARGINFWWLLPVLYAYFLIQIISGNIKDKIIIILTVYGMAIFTYFGGRAHPNNLIHISIPFILLSVYLIMQLHTAKIFVKHILLTLWLCVFLSINNQWIFTDIPVINSFWNINAAATLKYFFPHYQNSQHGFFPNRDTSYGTETISEPNCQIFSPLNKYVENHALFLLTEDMTFYRAYTCTHSHNSLGMNPYLETVIDRMAIIRAFEKLRFSQNRYVLVDARMINNYDSYGTNVTPLLLANMKLKKIGTIKISNVNLVIYLRSDMM